MRRIAQIAVTGLSFIPAIVAAQEWQALKDDQIRMALEGRVLEYVNGAWQDFRATGRTLYNAGGDSWGYWRVEGDQYCSQWPPSDLWTCYDVLADKNAGKVRFVGAQGDVSDGHYR